MSINLCVRSLTFYQKAFSSFAGWFFDSSFQALLCIFALQLFLWLNQLGLHRSWFNLFLTLEKNIYIFMTALHCLRIFMLNSWDSLVNSLFKYSTITYITGTSQGRAYLEKTFKVFSRPSSGEISWHYSNLCSVFHHKILQITFLLLKKGMMGCLFHLYNWPVGRTIISSDPRIKSRLHLFLYIKHAMSAWVPLVPQAKLEGSGAHLNPKTSQSTKLFCGDTPEVKLFCLFDVLGPLQFITQCASLWRWTFQFITRFFPPRYLLGL